MPDSLCSTCCVPCSMPGFPVFHHLPEFVQTHIHWIGGVVQPPHPLSSPSPLALHLSQDQGLFKWVGSLHQVAKVLELQHQSFQRIFRTNFLYDWLGWTPCCRRDFQESSPAPQLESIITICTKFQNHCSKPLILKVWKPATSVLPGSLFKKHKLNYSPYLESDPRYQGFNLNYKESFS